MADATRATGWNRFCRHSCPSQGVSSLQDWVSSGKRRKGPVGWVLFGGEGGGEDHHEDRARAWTTWTCHPRQVLDQAWMVAGGMQGPADAGRQPSRAIRPSGRSKASGIQDKRPLLKEPSQATGRTIGTHLRSVPDRRSTHAPVRPETTPIHPAKKGPMHKQASFPMDEAASRNPVELHLEHTGHRKYSPITFCVGLNPASTRKGVEITAATRGSRNVSVPCKKGKALYPKNVM